MTAEIAGWTFDLYALGVLALAALGFYLLLRHQGRKARRRRAEDSVMAAWFVDRSFGDFERWGRKKFP